MRFGSVSWGVELLALMNLARLVWNERLGKDDFIRGSRGCARVGGEVAGHGAELNANERFRCRKLSIGILLPGSLFHRMHPYRQSQSCSVASFLNGLRLIESYPDSARQ